MSLCGSSFRCAFSSKNCIICFNYFRFLGTLRIKIALNPWTYSSSSLEIPQQGYFFPYKPKKTSAAADIFCSPLFTFYFFLFTWCSLPPPLLIQPWWRDEHTTRKSREFTIESLLRSAAGVLFVNQVAFMMDQSREFAIASRLMSAYYKSSLNSLSVKPASFIIPLSV